MTRDDIRQAVVKALTDVAPEIDPSTLGPDQAFRQEFDLDSMDFLNFVIGLHTSLDIDIPEADYGQLVTVNAAVTYLAARLETNSHLPTPDDQPLPTPNPQLPRTENY
jgi:acyl carrier protein